jgi:hypothetical protein
LGRIGGSLKQATPMNQHRPNRASPHVQPRTQIARKSRETVRTLQNTILQTGRKHVHAQWVAGFSQATSLVDLITPAEAINYFSSCGYDPE